MLKEGNSIVTEAIKTMADAGVRVQFEEGNVLVEGETITNPHQSLLFSLCIISTREYFTFFRKTGAVFFDSRKIVRDELYRLI